MRSTIIACSALFIVGGLAQNWQPEYDNGLYARDAYPEAEAYDDEWDLGGELSRRDADDELDWALNARDVPDFDGPAHMYQRRSVFGGSEGAPEPQGFPSLHNNPDLSRASAGSDIAKNGFQGHTPEHESAMKAEAVRQESLKTPMGKMKQYTQGLQKNVNYHKQWLTDQVHGHVSKIQGHVGKAKAGFDNFAAHPSVEPYMSKMKAGLGQVAEHPSVKPYMEKASQYGGQVQKFMETHKPAMMPHMARRSVGDLQADGEALMARLERRAAFEGRVAHFKASREIHDY